MTAEGSQLAEVDGPRPAAIAGAVVCAGAAALLTLATAVLTYGLAESYGFGPVWDWSAFVMTAGAAALTGAAVLGAFRLARMRLRAVPVLVASVASVLAIGYVAGVLGNLRHH